MKKVFNPTTGEFDYVGEDGVGVSYVDNAGVQQGAISMDPDMRYVFSSSVGLLTVSFILPTDTGRSHTYELDFTAGDNVSVKIPGAVSWAKTPVFNPGKRYLVSIDISVVGGKTRIIGMYLEMEA